MRGRSECRDLVWNSFTSEREAVAGEEAEGSESEGSRVEL
jgi:hypothetical protein